MKWDIHIYDPKSETTTTHVKDYPGTSASMADAPAVVAKASRDFCKHMQYILAVPHREAKRHHATKKSPAQLQRDIDEVLASPGSYSYEENMAVREKKHAGVPRGGSPRAGHVSGVPRKEIVGFEFQIESNGRRYWTQLQGSGGTRGAGTLHAVHALDPKSQRVKAVCARELRAARKELRREGTIRIHQDREDPEQRIRAVPASAIKACRPIVA